MSEARAEGFLEIQDGFYEKNVQVDSNLRRGVARQDLIEPEPLKPRFTPSDNKKSFKVDVSCTRFASVYNEGIASDTRIVIQKDTSFTRIAGKNIIKDIKDFICPISGSYEASLLRKRLIGLQKIHKTISNEVYRFGIQEP